MEKKVITYCSGNECPVRNTCLRYTKRDERKTCGSEYRLILKCRRQINYLQDESRVNTDGAKHR